jgi:DNA-binding NarL/FixJ family response regulator
LGFGELHDSQGIVAGLYMGWQLDYGLVLSFSADQVHGVRPGSGGKAVHVLLIDDHQMFRQGVKFLLSDLDESLLFTEAGTSAQGLEALSQKTVDLVLLDLNMPGSDGLSALRELRQGFPEVPLAVLSGVDDPHLIRESIEAGASGFVPKSSSSEVLVAALKLILAGAVYLPRAVLDGSLEPVPGKHAASGVKGAQEDRASLLSERQTDVLLKAIQGKPNKVIALEMDIAEGTVKTHLSAAFRILGVHNRTEAVFAAANLGLRPPINYQS